MSRIVSSAKQALAHVTSVSLMTALVACAYMENLREKQPAEDISGDSEDNIQTPTPSQAKMTAKMYAELYGYRTEEHVATTPDGFLLGMERIQSRSRYDPRKEPVLLVHGLFQSSGVFVTSGVNSLAFVLADRGYDVWLANNRCVEKRHVSLGPHQEEFWDWSLDELAKYDFPSFINFVLLATGKSKLTYIGHSQGTAQAFLGLSFNPGIAEKLNFFIALAPALYLGPLLNSPPMSFLVDANDSVLRTVFGCKEFVPIMGPVREYFPSAVFSDIAYRMFSYLFRWKDTQWDKNCKEGYFQFTPRPTSVKALAHWFQTARHSKYIQPFRKDGIHQPEPTVMHHIDSAVTINDFGGFLSDSFDVRCIKCPFAMFYGAKDEIVDAGRLARQCACDMDPEHFILSQCIDEYEHMDVIWARDAKEKVFDMIGCLLEKQSTSC